MTAEFSGEAERGIWRENATSVIAFSILLLQMSYFQYVS